MADFFARIWRGKSEAGAHEKMDRAYVSEFTCFIGHFIEDHPEVVRDQWTGREIYWDKEVDFSAQEQAVKDSVPEDGYGFLYSAWVGDKKIESKQ